MAIVDSTYLSGYGYDERFPTPENDLCIIPLNI